MLPSAVTKITTDPATPSTPAQAAQPAGTFPKVNANTVLVNATTGQQSPAGLPMAASTILARLAAGNIVAATVAQIKTLLAYALGDLGVIAASTIVGNNTGGSAAPAALTASQTAALLAGTTPKTGTDTIALAKLTLTGANGSYSITFVNGLVTSTSYTPPT